MLETPLHFSVSRDRAIAMVREEWPEFTEEQFDDLIDRKRIDWRLIDGELFVLDNFLDSLRVYPKEVPACAPILRMELRCGNQMLKDMESQGGLSRAITLKASMSVPRCFGGRDRPRVATRCRRLSSTVLYRGSRYDAGGCCCSRERFGAYCLVVFFE